MPTDPHPPHCLCADCLASVPDTALPWERAYDPAAALHAQLAARLAPLGCLVRVSSLDSRAWQAFAVDAGDGSHADDQPTGVAGSHIGALEALADALDAREERAAPRGRPAVARTLADAYPRGVTLSPAEVDALVSDLRGRRAMGGA